MEHRNSGLVFRFVPDLLDLEIFRTDRHLRPEPKVLLSRGDNGSPDSRGIGKGAEGIKDFVVLPAARRGSGGAHAGKFQIAEEFAVRIKLFDVRGDVLQV